MYATPFIDRVLEYSETSSNAEPANGPVLSNGHLQVHVTAPAAPGSLATTGRTIVGSERTLDFTDIKRESPGPVPPIKICALHMATGVYRAVAGHAEAEFETRIAALRQCTACVLQEVRCRDPSTLLHTVRPVPGMRVARADLVVRNVAGHPLPHLLVEGTVGGSPIAYCCAYVGASIHAEGVRESVPGSDAVESVIRTDASNASFAMMHAAVHGPVASAESAFQYCSAHFRNLGDPIESIARAWETHSLRWATLWRGGLSIEPTLGATYGELETVRVLNIHVQTALYRILSDFVDTGSSVPSSVTSETYAMDSDYFATGRATDLATTRLRPYTLMEHIALAPFAPWLPSSQPLAKPTAWTPMLELAGRLNDAWDIYRVTLDRAHLASNFGALRRHVDEMTDRVQGAGASVVTGAPVSTGAVRVRSGLVVSEDAFTTGSVARAFGSAEQICNTLRLPADRAWSDLRGKLVVPRAGAFSVELDGARPATAQTDSLVLLHPALLRPYANATDLGPFSALMDGNLAALQAAARGPACSAAFAAIAALAADIARLSTVVEMGYRQDACAGWLMQRCEESLDARWGAASSAQTESAADILACLAFGFLRMKVRGYVTRDGIHTVPASLLPGPSTTVLPAGWRVVRRRTAQAGLGGQTEHLTQNVRAVA